MGCEKIRRAPAHIDKAVLCFSVVQEVVNCSVAIMGTPLQIALFLLVIAPACIQAVEPGDATELLKNAFDGARKKLSKMDQDIFEQKKTKDTEVKADEGSETASELDAQAAISARAKIEVDTSREASAQAIAKAQTLDIEAN